MKVFLCAEDYINLQIVSFQISEISSEKGEKSERLLTLVGLSKTYIVISF